MKPIVAVLGGGVSPEHDVSLVSASEVLAALESGDWPTLAVWIDRRGQWHLIDRPGDAVPWSAAELRRLGQDAPAMHALAAVRAIEQRGAEVVFPALHGRGGEDGEVQALLACAGLACVGSGMAASALGMSKVVSRLVFESAGLPMAPALRLNRRQSRLIGAAELAARIQDTGLRWPVYLKEDRCGSSLGVERVTEPSGLEAALARIRALGPYWIVEQGIDGVELTCAVLGNSGDRLRALPPVEIRPRTADFFDYESKYDSSATEELCPPVNVDAATCERAGELAVAAHDVLGCRGCSRTDMICDGEGLKILETNTIPGLTPESLLPKAARAAGLDFRALCVVLIGYATAGLERTVEVPRPERRQAGGAIKNLNVYERTD